MGISTPMYPMSGQTVLCTLLRPIRTNTYPVCILVLWNPDHQEQADQKSARYPFTRGLYPYSINRLHKNAPGLSQPFRLASKNPTALAFHLGHPRRATSQTPALFKDCPYNFCQTYLEDMFNHLLLQFRNIMWFSCLSFPII